MSLQQSFIKTEKANTLHFVQKKEMDFIVMLGQSINDMMTLIKRIKYIEVNNNGSKDPTLRNNFKI